MRVGFSPSGGVASLSLLSACAYRPLRQPCLALLMHGVWDCVPEAFEPFGEDGGDALDLADMGDEAEAIGVPMRGAVRQMMAVANATCGPASDFTSIARLLESWAGVEIRSRQ
jgi:hypothetical protein